MVPSSTRQWTTLLVLGLVLLASLIAARGLFSSSLLAGHDARAYPVTQQQFHENIRSGVIFPRWAPDMRYGYGHPKLQFRPPLLHYLAEPCYAMTGNVFLSINLAVVALVILSGFGAYLCCRCYTKAPAAMIGAISYLTCNYLLSDLYIRGAYYEVAAMAFMPWILWAQFVCFRGRLSSLSVLVGGMAWAGLACGHPQLLAFFFPVALLHLLFTWNESRNHNGLLLAGTALVGGLLIAAPYLYVAYRELPWVRMEIFGTGLEAYRHHFLSWKELVAEPWPEKYVHYSWHDYLTRPRHLEMRTASWWTFSVLLLTPLLWLLRPARYSRFKRLSLLYMLCTLGMVVLCLPISRGIWALFSPLHTFNFPWRSLSVASFCTALLAALVFDELRRRLKLRNEALVLASVIGVVLVTSCYPKSKGWPGVKWFTHAEATSTGIRHNAGIPQQFYTPSWVSDYPKAPAQSPIRVIEGNGIARVVSRNAVQWKIRVDAESPLKLAVSHHYYPGWQVTGIGSEAIPAKPLPATGEITFDAPKGKHDVILTFALTQDRILAYIMSVTGLVLLLVTALMCRCRPKQRS